MRRDHERDHHQVAKAENDQHYGRELHAAYHLILLHEGMVTEAEKARDMAPGPRSSRS
jgi:hypothetical protein